MTVSIIIPNYNTWELVERNINACLKYDDRFINEIIVVDDFSTIENTINFPSKVRIIRNEYNLHYTQTVNVGLKLAKGDLLILLDSDAHPTHSFIQDLITEYFNNKKLGCIGFKTINRYGKDSGNFMYFPSVLSLIVGQQIHALLKRYDFRNNRKIIPFSCAISFRKNCLEELDYFDDKFYVLDADTDLAFRIHQSSWKLLYQPRVEIFHEGGNSIPKNYERVILFYRSRWQLLKKYKLIPFKRLIKKTIILRFKLELLFFKFKELQYPNQQEKYKMKKMGRAELIKIVNTFN